MSFENFVFETSLAAESPASPVRNSQKPCRLLLITVRSADNRSNIAYLVKNIRHTHRGLRPLCDSAARDVFRKLCFRDILGCGLWPRLRNSQKPCVLLLITVRSADNRSNIAYLVKNIRHTPRGLRPLCDSAARDVVRKLRFRDILGCGISGFAGAYVGCSFLGAFDRLSASLAQK